MDVELKEQIEENYEYVRQTIREVCGRCGRDPEDITIVAVTKTHPPELVETALGSGINHIGENKIQEAEDKAGTVKQNNGTFHFIGHLQTNKAKKAVEIFDMVQSIDSVKIARRLSDKCVEAGKVMDSLVQVNCSGEESKFGFPPDKLLEAVEEIKDLRGLNIQGLMTIGPFVDDENQIRDDFSRTRELYEQMRGRYPQLDIKHLSMGMTNDYAIAIEEGSNMVRLGTVLFGPRNVNK
ncbi:MAG: YggS family pyridoxal phosphate-dependent enzyme [candidate division Zixibacteria bacterium]|nr:YggS family pyridoxal phosphate-dependent enzyme [candidate division Zixibacteria bacterium]